MWTTDEDTALNLFLISTLFLINIWGYNDSAKLLMALMPNLQSSAASGDQTVGTQQNLVVSLLI